MVVALASEPTVCLHREKDLEMAVYCGSGAYIRQLEPLLRWLSERHTVEIFRDYFVFKQLLDQKNVATFTTRLVQRYRYDGENRVVIPLTDEGIAANYWLSFLKGSEKRLAPLQKWINQNTDLLFGAESRGK